MGKNNYNLELTPEQLSDIVANNEVVGQGSYGIVYRIDEDTLFKFRYKDYIDCFALEDGVYNLRKLGDITEEVNSWKNIENIINRGKGSQDIIDINKLIHMQHKIKRTQFPQGFARVNGHRVGYILPYHKNMVNLDQQMTHLNYQQKLIVIENIRLAIEELISLKIYLNDLTTKNILINPQTLEIQIIDVDEHVTVSKIAVHNFSRKTIKQFNFIRDYLLSLESENTDDTNPEL